MILYLNSPWFELVKEGKKIYEGRRNTEVIRQIRIGDILEVKHYINNELESYHVIVEDKFFYKTFEEALQSLDMFQILPLDKISLAQGIEIYKKYVSLATQEKDGVCMLKIKHIDKNI